MDELLSALFLAAVQLSGLPAIEQRPAAQAMPYALMLQELCAGLKVDVRHAQAERAQCRRLHAMRPEICGDAVAGQRAFLRCSRQNGLVAAYIIEERRIVYRDDLDLELDTDNSFIVHEFVHALQHQHRGDRTFASCSATLAAEQQAYAVQQRYLHARGQMLRVGERLRWVHCDDLL